jgi:hypothetical protein
MIVEQVRRFPLTYVFSCCGVCSFFKTLWSCVPCVRVVCEQIYTYVFQYLQIIYMGYWDAL